MDGPTLPGNQALAVAVVNCSRTPTHAFQVITAGGTRG